MALLDSIKKEKEKIKFLNSLCKSQYKTQRLSDLIKRISYVFKTQSSDKNTV